MLQTKLVAGVFLLCVLGCGSDDDPQPAVDAGASNSDAATQVDAASDLDAQPDMDESVTWQGWTMTPGISVPAAGMVQAHITFERTDGVDMRGGGMCLIRFEGTSCTVADDCPDAPTGGYPDGHIYCVSHNGSAPACWVRPGVDTEYCHKSPANVPGTYDTPIAAGTGLWMTQGCMADDADPRGCASGDPNLFVYATSRMIQVP